MMYVCLWSPDWSIAAASGAEGDAGAATPGAHRTSAGVQAHDAAAATAEAAPLLAGEAPRLRVEREVLWADGRGLDAARLAERLLDRLTELRVTARAGVAAVPIAAELGARWGRPARDSGGPTPFLVKERTGWGWRKPEAGAGGTPRRERSDEAVESGGGAEPDPVAVESPSPESPESRPIVVIPAGTEREWLARLPLAALRPPDRVLTLLDGVGISTLGGLAALEREAVEVRLGGGAVALWRLARADDRRLLFDRIPPERPHGSIDFVDYVLTDPARLVFTANALLGPLCDRLVGRGEHARALRLTLPLANGDSWARTIRPARPTASRETWLRLIRGLLDRITVPDSVAGMRLEVGATEEAAVRQGDLFDRGFATAAAVEAAVARLAERQLHPQAPETTAHPLMERRATWRRRDDAGAAGAAGASGVGTTGVPESSGGGAGVAGVAGAAGVAGVDPDQESGRGHSLQLLPEPRPIVVETARRRDHDAPTRFRDRRGWRDLAIAAGPDRISGGQWEPAAYAREYYRCTTTEGVVLWIYRDGIDERWFLHGWWD